MEEQDHMVEDVDFMDSEPTSKDKMEVSCRCVCAQGIPGAAPWRLVEIPRR